MIPDVFLSDRPASPKLYCHFCLFSMQRVRAKHEISATVNIIPELLAAVLPDVGSHSSTVFGCQISSPSCLRRFSRGVCFIFARILFRASLEVGAVVHPRPCYLYMTTNEPKWDMIGQDRKDFMFAPEAPAAALVTHPFSRDSRRKGILKRVSDRDCALSRSRNRNQLVRLVGILQLLRIDGRVWPCPTES